MRDSVEKQADICYNQTNEEVYKRHYMDNEELSFEETVDEMLETWKDVMRKLYNLFGKLNAQVREMPAEEPEDRTEGPSDSMTE